MRKRAFDVVVAALAGVGLLIPLIAVGVVVRLTSRGPAIYWSDRIGRGNTPFRMPKFRTMRLDTPALATHLLPDPKAFLTPVGGLLRRTSVDELPQLWSILVGDMSLVGPRPALYNQDDLIALRTATGVHALAPGLTGWAQVNGRDDLSVSEKVRLDSEYLERRSFGFDLAIIGLTLRRAFAGAGVAH